MDDFFRYFILGLSGGLVSGFTFFLVGRSVRNAFGLVGRSALMR